MILRIVLSAGGPADAKFSSSLTPARPVGHRTPGRGPLRQELRASWRRAAGDLMKLHYYAETDSLYIELNARPSAESREIADGLVVDFDAQGNVVGIDVDQASKKLDLASLEAESLPATRVRIG